MDGPFRRVDVVGPSMVPALRHGDRLLVWLRPPRGLPRPGTVVVVELPDRPLAVKRLASVEADGSIRVEGDNPFGSTDSRTLGPLPAAALRGTVILRTWPWPGWVRRRKPGGSEHL
jgi:nickel-type superoxide dismutase maturation protease